MKQLLIALLLFFSLAHCALGLTFTYDETDLVSVVPTAFDDDGDNLTFIYSSPLNTSGEWQTGYEDSGEYTVTVQAFDGELSSEAKTFTIIVNDVNRAPFLSVPDVIVNEGDLATIQAAYSDPDGDNLGVEYSIPFNDSGEWQTDFDDAGTYNVTVTVTDGVDTVKSVALVTVNNVNQPPELSSYSPRTAPVLVEGESVRFSASATDFDNDDLIYKWYVDGERKETGQHFTFDTGYDDSGTRTVLLEVSDGTDSVENEWRVQVQNVNRAPALPISDVTASEGETINLNLPDFDDDGDKISYTISDKFNDNGVWQTDFDDAGTYEVTVLASDGQLFSDKTITVTVKNTDRAPVISPVEDATINENQQFNLNIKVTDPDGDKVKLTVQGLPSATLEGSTLSYVPGYDTVKLPETIVARGLNYAHLDTYVYDSEKVFPINLSACGSSLCSVYEFNLTVQNVNRLPELTVPSQIITNESSLVHVNAKVSDPDGDRLTLSFSDPINSAGYWKPGYDDEGVYDVLVSAYDGKDTVNKSVRITVHNSNRPPKFHSIPKLIFYENESLSYAIPFSDPDNDKIILFMEDLPAGASIVGSNFTYELGYDDLTFDREINLTFGITDRPFDNPYGHIITTTVKAKLVNVNRKPILTKLSPDKSGLYAVGDRIIFEANAFDPDGQNLTYEWNFGTLDTIIGPKKLARKFTVPGPKQITLAVSDGQDETEYVWNLELGVRKRINK